MSSFQLPLFPLQTVLFPGGVLPLRIFEVRYLDLISRCQKEGAPFGVVCLSRGGEVRQPPRAGEAGGAPVEPEVFHSIGTLAHITAFERPQPGLMLIRCRGGRRFRILESRVEPGGLQRARVQLIDEPEPVPVPQAQAGLLSVLKQIAADLGAERMPEPHAWDDAAWVGYRLTEVMPVQLLAKQKLLELDDPVSRLEILYRYLEPRGLVK